MNSKHHTHSHSDTIHESWNKFWTSKFRRVFPKERGWRDTSPKFEFYSSLELVPIRSLPIIFRTTGCRISHVHSISSNFSSFLPPFFHRRLLFTRNRKYSHSKFLARERSIQRKGQFQPLHVDSTNSQQGVILAFSKESKKRPMNARSILNVRKIYQRKSLCWHVPWIIMHCIALFGSAGKQWMQQNSLAHTIHNRTNHSLIESTDRHTGLHCHKVSLFDDSCGLYYWIDKYHYCP